MWLMLILSSMRTSVPARPKSWAMPVDDADETDEDEVWPAVGGKLGWYFSFLLFLFFLRSFF